MLEFTEKKKVNESGSSVRIGGGVTFRHTKLFGFLKIVKCFLSQFLKSQFTKAVWLSNYLSYYTTILILHIIQVWNMRVHKFK